MKENKYDDDVFFKKYSEMSRSKDGLKGAGEWREFEKLMPNFKFKNVLDLGCGYGWHCKYAAERDASYVLGVDISKKMLERAKEINSAKNIEYRLSAMEDLNFPENTFDVVISSLAFHYINNIESLIKKISSWIKSGGDFVFSVEHPIFTSYGSQDWYYDEKGDILHFPVDNYYYEGKREAIFLGERVTKYHRTLTTYVNSLFNNGFQLTGFVEPKPPEDMLNIPRMSDEMRRPMMLLIKAVKK